MSGTVLIDNIQGCKKAGVTCRDFRAKEFSLDFHCAGGTDNGGWETISPDPDLPPQKCWQSLEICYEGTPRGCINLTEDSAYTPEVSIIYESISPISSLKLANNFSFCDANSSSHDKEYCMWENNFDGSNFSDAQTDTYAWKKDDLSGGADHTSGLLTGNTGDDMFRLPPNTSAFFEYVDIDQSTKYGLQYIERGSAVNFSMMVPSGPKSDYADYKNFIDNPPEETTLSPDNIKVQNACFPVKAKITCAIDEEILEQAIPTVGNCGPAHNTTMYAADIPSLKKKDYCKSGDYIYVGIDEYNVMNWQCKGTNEDLLMDCYATIID